MSSLKFVIIAALVTILAIKYFFIHELTIGSKVFVILLTLSLVWLVLKDSLKWER